MKIKVVTTNVALLKYVLTLKFKCDFCEDAFYRESLSLRISRNILPRRNLWTGVLKMPMKDNDIPWTNTLIVLRSTCLGHFFRETTKKIHQA